MDDIIDFELASKEWRKNKVSLGNGCFAYRCKYIHSNGRHCPKVVSAQKFKYMYRIREDWIKQPGYSMNYCSRHMIRGPVQECKNILNKLINDNK
jgi:hypothetical protein